jgi:hypothetical protein
VSATSSFAASLPTSSLYVYFVASLRIILTVVCPQLILKVLAAVVALITEVTDARCLPLIQAVACLVADLVAAIIAIVRSLLALILALVINLLFSLLSGCVELIITIGVGSYWKSKGITLAGL